MDEHSQLTWTFLRLHSTQPSFRLLGLGMMANILFQHGCEAGLDSDQIADKNRQSSGGDGDF